MAHQAPDFETKDVYGKTQHFSGSVGTSSLLVPAVAGNKISSILIKNPASNGVNDILSVAFDGGTTYITLKRGEFAAWSPKNNASNTPITQVRIIGSSASVNYESVMDFEP
jgi:hypothetical protein